MKTKYTPGPWTIHSSGHIRQLDPLGFNSLPRNEADKFLMAAAPELLDALEQGLKLLKTYNEDVWLEYATEAERVIKKARGL